jgi:hypothetical protein
MPWGGGRSRLLAGVWLLTVSGMTRSSRLKGGSRQDCRPHQRNSSDPHRPGHRGHRPQFGARFKLEFESGERRNRLCPSTQIVSC